MIGEPGREALDWAERFSSPWMEGRAKATHDAELRGAVLVPTLIEIIVGVDARNGHPWTDQSRRGAIIALGRIGPLALAATDVLLSVLSCDENECLRAEAAHAVAAVGGKSERVVPALVEACTRAAGTSEAPFEAAAALGRLGSEEAIAGLISVVSSEQGEVPTQSQYAAARVLGGLGRRARAAIPALRAIALAAETGGAEARLRVAATEALRLIDA